MQNYFNDTEEVLRTTERLLSNDILACQTALIEHENFFELCSYSPYEVAGGLSEDTHEARREFLEQEDLKDVMLTVRNYDFQNITTIKEIPYSILEDVAEEYCFEPPLKEPLEWWLVSPWLYDSLRKLDFVTLDTEWGFYWGRTTSGQAIELDNVIQDVARLLHNTKRQSS